MICGDTRDALALLRAGSVHLMVTDIPYGVQKGTAGLDLCYVAAGRVDAFVECCLRPWDYAAASLIIQEAGGIVTALDGSPLRFIDRCSVAVGSPQSHPELMKLVGRVLQQPDMKGILP